MNMYNGLNNKTEIVPNTKIITLYKYDLSHSAVCRREVVDITFSTNFLFVYVETFMGV